MCNVPNGLQLESTDIRDTYENWEEKFPPDPADNVAMSILIVEDNAVSAKLIKIILRKNGFQTMEAYNGGQALEILEKCSDIQAMVVDIIMPEMDGLDLVRRVRENPSWRNMPVVMCSVLSDVDTIRKSAALGCHHYVLKPVSEERLMEKLRLALGDGAETTESTLSTTTTLDRELLEDQEVVDALTQIMRAKTDRLQTLLGDGTYSGTCRQIALDLEDVAEGAALFGASGLVAILGRIGKKGENPQVGPSASDRDTLMMEWSVLQRDLHRCSSPTSRKIFIR